MRGSSRRCGHPPPGGMRSPCGVRGCPQPVGVHRPGCACTALAFSRLGSRFACPISLPTWCHLDAVHIEGTPRAPPAVTRTPHRVRAPDPAVLQVDWIERDIQAVTRPRSGFTILIVLVGAVEAGHVAGGSTTYLASVRRENRNGDHSPYRPSSATSLPPRRGAPSICCASGPARTPGMRSHAQPDMLWP